VRYGAPRDLATLDREALIQAIQDCGMVGLGGRHSRPTPSWRCRTTSDRYPDRERLRVRAYLTNDDRVMVEWATTSCAHRHRAARLRRGACRHRHRGQQAARHRIAAPTPARSCPHCRRAGRTKYPQGAERLLIKTLLGREIPSGARSWDIGVVTQNIATLAELGQLLPLQRGLIERVITIGGDVERPGNYLVPFGTPLRYLLEQAGFREAAGEIILADR